MFVESLGMDGRHVVDCGRLDTLNCATLETSVIGGIGALVLISVLF